MHLTPKTDMLKNTLPVVLFIAVFSCTAKNEEKLTAPPPFTYFEISYESGWKKGITFFTDSNYIYFFPDFTFSADGGALKYGILPDSIRQKVDSVVLFMGDFKSISRDSVNCVDCGLISVKKISQNDTLKIFQAGEIDQQLTKLAELLYQFRADGAHSSAKALIFNLETAKDVAPPPPPPLKSN